MGGNDLRIAFGPVGAAGLVLLLLGLVRRSSGLAAAGGIAVAADVTLPQLRGFAAMQRAPSSAGTLALRRVSARSRTRCSPSSGTS